MHPYKDIIGDFNGGDTATLAHDFDNNALLLKIQTFLIN